MSGGTSTPGAPRLSQFVARSLEGRNYPLDTLRGLAIVGMILVNSAPPTDLIYPPLVHASWNGWTLADTVFPLFLFVVGVSIAFAVQRPDATNAVRRREIYWKIGRRAVLLFAIDLGLVNFPYYELNKLQLTGVLTHIAVCYVIVALLHLHTNWRLQLALIPTICLAHWALLEYLQVPGFGAGDLTPEGNASRFVDQVLLGPHTHSFYSGQIETSGVLEIFSSVSTVLIGLLAGRWIASESTSPKRIAAMFATGFTLFVIGNVWNVILPINKALWTASYVCLTGGISLQLLAMAGWILDHYAAVRPWAKPLQMAGVNALAFFVSAGVLQRVLVYGRVSTEGHERVMLRKMIYEEAVAPWMPGKFGALIFTVLFLLLCFAFVAFLYRKKVFIKL
jgi:predicted acyltransferase